MKRLIIIAALLASACNPTQQEVDRLTHRQIMQNRLDSLDIERRVWEAEKMLRESK